LPYGGECWFVHEFGGCDAAAVGLGEGENLGGLRGRPHASGITGSSADGKRSDDFSIGGFGE